MAYGTYDKQVKHSGLVDQGMAAAIALEAAAGVILRDTQYEPITVTRFGYVPTVAFNYDTLVTEGVLTLYKYPVAAGTGKVALATIPLKDAALVDNIYYVDLDNALGKADIKAGEQVVIEITTQAVGGTEVGDFQPFFCFNPRAEVAANQSKMHNLTT